MTTTVPDSVKQPATIAFGAGVVVTARHKHAVTTSTQFTAAADKIQLGVLPAGHTLVDAILDSDDLDAATGLVMSVGTADSAAAIITGSTVGQTGGIERANVRTCRNLAAGDTDLPIYAYATTPPTTDADGTLALTLLYTPTPRG